MVGFNAVVEIFRLTVPDGLDIRIIPPQLPQRFTTLKTRALLCELGYRFRANKMIVEIDYMVDQIALRGSL